MHIWCINLADLQKAITKAYNPPPDVAIVKVVHDYKKWMEPHIPPIHDHLKAHAFKFVKHRGTTVMFYKEWATDKSWLPKSGLQILMKDKQPHPDTFPELVQPSLDSANLDKLETTLRKISAYLRSEAKAWWDEWITNARETDGQQSQLLETEGMYAIISTTGLIVCMRMYV